MKQFTPVLSGFTKSFSAMATKCPSAAWGRNESVVFGPLDLASISSPDGCLPTILPSVTRVRNTDRGTLLHSQYLGGWSGSPDFKTSLGYTARPRLKEKDERDSLGNMETQGSSCPKEPGHLLKRVLGWSNGPTVKNTYCTSEKITLNGHSCSLPQ